MTPSRPLPVAAALVLVCMVWGSTWLAIKFNIADFPPLRAAGLRFVLAAGVIALTAGRRRLPAGQRPGTAFWLGLSCVMIMVPYACVYWGEQHIPSGLTAVLFATYPLFVSLLAHRGVAGEALTPRLLAGLAIGFAGVLTLFAGDLRAQGAPALVGGGLILGSAVSSAVATVMVKRRLSHLDPLLINLRPMLYGGLMLLALSALLERHREWHAGPRSLAALLYLALFGSVIAFGLYYWLMRTLPVSRLSFIVYVTPLVAVGLGATLAEEPVTWRLLAGTALVLGSVVLSRRPRQSAGAGVAPATGP